jgi:hypothetical protein
MRVHFVLEVMATGCSPRPVSMQRRESGLSVDLLGTAGGKEPPGFDEREADLELRMAPAMTPSMPLPPSLGTAPDDDLTGFTLCAFDTVCLFDCDLALAQPYAAWKRATGSVTLSVNLAKALSLLNVSTIDTASIESVFAISFNWPTAQLKLGA